MTEHSQHKPVSLNLTMGLDHDHLLSTERHYCEFICGACSRLTSIDSYVSSVCSHPICKSCCVGEDRDKCPSCQGDIGELKPLDKAQPLAHRVLRKIRVACPGRKKNNCSWSGDYGDLANHTASHRRGVTNKNPIKRKSSRRPSQKPVTDDASTVEGSINEKEASTRIREKPQTSKPVEGASKHPSRTTRRSSSSTVKRTDSDTSELTSSDLISSAPPMRDNSEKSSTTTRRHDDAEPQAEARVAPQTQHRKAQRRWSMEYTPEAPVVRAPEGQPRRNSADQCVKKSPDQKAAQPSPRGPNEKSSDQAYNDANNRIRSFLKRGNSFRGSDDNQEDTPDRSRGLIRTASKRFLDGLKEGRDGRLKSPDNRVRSKSPGSFVRRGSNRSSELGAGTRGRLFARRKSTNTLSNPTVPMNDLTKARTFKEKATKAVSVGNHIEAVVFYTSALDSIPYPDEQPAMTCFLYSNRAASLLRTNSFSMCIRDCDEALRLDCTIAKAYSRKAWALVEVELLDDASRTLETGLAQIPHNPDLKRELKFTKELSKTVTLVQQLLADDRHQEVLAATESLGVPFKKNKFIMLARAKAFYHLNDTEKMLEEVNAVFGRDSQNVDALAIRAEGRFLNAHLEDATMDCQTALGIDPQRKDIEKTYNKVREVESFVREAEMRVRNNSFDHASNVYTKAIRATEPLVKTTELYRMLHLRRASSQLCAANYVLALGDVSLVLKHDAENEAAWEIKVAVLAALKRYGQLKQELDPIIKSWGTDNKFLNEIYNEACNPGMDYSSTARFLAFQRQQPAMN